MQKRFSQKIEEMRRLIGGSASVSVSGEGSRGGRKCAATQTSFSAHRYLLAVSGGMDSMCMADLFLKTVGAGHFAIAHCNFSLRGEESDGDEAMVREWAQSNDVQLFVKRFDTVAYAREKGISIEMAARDLRYGWFAQLCQEHGFATLSVAHNANDNAETLMLNLLRGTGLNGLHGMDMYSDIPVGSFDDGGGYGITNSRQHVAVFRPLLEFTRKQVEGYVLTHRIPYRHDSSNFESDYKRNRIRNEVFPIFEKINPSFIRTLNHEIGYFAEAGSIVDDWCRSKMPQILTSPIPEHAGDALSVKPDMSVEAKRLNINISALMATPHWRYLLYYILEPYGFNSQTIASIESLLDSDRTISGKRFESSTHTLHTTSNELLLVPHSCRTPHSSNVHLEETGLCHTADVAVVRGAGIYNFNASRFQVEVAGWSPDMPVRHPQGTLILDADKLKFPFICRRWRKGDWFIPLGMRGKKKVSDLFADLKYSSLDKDAAIIMVDTLSEGLAGQQHIAGLLGVRIDDRYRVTLSTRTVLRITML